MVASYDLLHGHLGRQIPKTMGCVFFFNSRSRDRVIRLEVKTENLTNDDEEKTRSSSFSCRKKMGASASPCIRLHSS